MSTGGRIGLSLGSAELRNAPMITLTDKRTPADIQALLAHVAAFDTCVLVDSASACLQSAAGLHASTPAMAGHRPSTSSTCRAAT
jgi:hypothetical protein